MNRNPLKITEYLYKILNVSEITDLLETGSGVYRNQKPINSELNDIVIGILGSVSGREFSGNQNGIVNINIYAKKINGFPDIEKLENISDKVLEVLENNQNNHTDSFYYQIKESGNIFEEQQQNTLNYFNIKLNVHLN